MIIHRNKWNWGKTWIILTNSGDGIIKISEDHEDGVVISGLSVLPNSRGKGIGTLLMAEAEKIIKEEIPNTDIITLYVEDNKEELKRWYENLGYYCIDLEDGYYKMLKFV